MRFLPTARLNDHISSRPERLLLIYRKCIPLHPTNSRNKIRVRATGGNPVYCYVFQLFSLFVLKYKSAVEKFPHLEPILGASEKGATFASPLVERFMNFFKWVDNKLSSQKDRERDALEGLAGREKVPQSVLSAGEVGNQFTFSPCFSGFGVKH